MLKLRTKTAKTVPAKPPLRGTIDVIVRLVVDGGFFDINSITPQGYYYYIDENNQIVKLDCFGPKATQSWDIMIQTENQGIVPKLESDTNLFHNLMQRLNEFTDLQQEVESGLNYGIIPSDWEADIDIL